MSIIDAMLTNNQTSIYLEKIFDTPIDVTGLLIFLTICLFIGFTAISVRYVIHPRDEREYKKWHDEKWYTKSLFSIILGLSSYCITIIFGELLSAFEFAISGQTASVIPVYRIIGIFLATIYATTLLMYFGKKHKSTYSDIECAVIFSLVLFMPIMGLTIVFVAFAISPIIGAIGFIAILIMGAILWPVLSRRYKQICPY